MRFSSLLVVLPAFGWAEYNESRAIKYAELAGAAYCQAPSLESWSCGEKCFKGVNHVKVCQGDSTQAFVGIWDERCMVSFEGTNGMASVQVDMETTYKLHLHCDGCQVHRGFLNEWNSLSSCVKEAFASIGCGPKRPIRATGHSLGGAVVTLAMFDLKWNKWEVDEIYTFGQPRVGNQKFAMEFDQMFKDRFFRVTHGKDPFVDMPLGPFFVHVEPEVFYVGDIKDGYTICSNEWNKNCSSQYFQDWQGVFSASGRAWHHNYMEVPTTMQGCLTAGAKCGHPIEDSWCSYGIACNVDQRGPEAYCKYGSIVKGGYGKCWCHEGFCPSDTGRCVPKTNSTESSPEADSPRVVLSMNEVVESSVVVEAFPLVMALALITTSLLFGCLAMRMRSRGDGTPHDLYNHLM